MFISQVAQAVQSRAVIEQYRDEVLIAYIKEMGDLLENRNGSITSDFVSRTLARVKTNLMEHDRRISLVFSTKLVYSLQLINRPLLISPPLN